MRGRLYFHVGLWSALFALFLVRSVLIVGPAMMENRIGPAEVNQSIDAYLRALTGIQGGLEKVSDILRRLPKAGPVIIFVRDENAQSEFLGMMIGYVSWPREVQLIKIAGPTVEKELADINPDSVAGLMFCSVNPPGWLEKRVQLGSNIVFAPVPEPGP